MRFDPDRVAIVVLVLAGMVTVLAQTVREQSSRLRALEAARIDPWRLAAIDRRLGAHEDALRRHSLLSVPASTMQGATSWML